MKRITGIEFRHGVAKAAHRIAADFGSVISLAWCNGVTTACINSQGAIRLAMVADDAMVNQTLVNKYVGFVVHELLHRKFTDFDKNSKNEYVRVLHNAVEDAWIEGLGISQRLTGNIEKLLGGLIDNMTTEALAQPINWADPAQYPYALAVYLRAHATIKVPLAEGLEPIFAEAALRLNSAKSSADTLAIAEYVYNEINKKNKKDKKKKEKEQEKEQGKEQGQPVYGLDEAMEVEPSLGEDNGLCGMYDNTRIQFKKHYGDSLIWSTEPIVTARLRHEVKKMFENSALDSHERNHRAGSLNVKALAGLGSTDRLFKRRLESDGVDSAVVILIDVSNSMWDTDAGGKFLIAQAISTAATLIDTLHRAQVKTAIITFGSAVGMLKGFGESKQTAIARLAGINDGGSTNDFTALKYAHEILYARPELRRVAFVLTDGTGNAEATKAQAISGNALGITTIGIGICSDVSHVYPNVIKVDGDLGNVSFKQIKLAA